MPLSRQCSSDTKKCILLSNAFYVRPFVDEVHAYIYYHALLDKLHFHLLFYN
jgi:hypothetical protein